MKTSLQICAAIAAICYCVAYVQAYPQVTFPRSGVRDDDVLEARGVISRRSRPLYIVLSRDRRDLLKVYVRGARHQMYIVDLTKRPVRTFTIRSDNISPGGDYNVRIRKIPGKMEIYFAKKLIEVLAFTEIVNSAVLKGTYTSGQIKTAQWYKYKCLSDKPCGRILNQLAVAENECPRVVQHKRIIGGVQAEAGANPWQVAIRRKRPMPGEHPHVCGGVLIDSCWVLSATHCFPLSNDHKTHIVRVGDYYNAEGKEKYFKKYESSQEFDIVRIIKHNMYWTSPSTRNDIALVLLRKGEGDRCVQYGDFVQPVCLPTSATQYRDNSECVITGWGATEQDQKIGDYPPCLQQASVVITNQTHCKTFYPDDPEGGPKILDSMVCAEGGVVGSTQVDACQGDSGGPLVCSTAKETGIHTIWGVTSWGEGCGKKPGVYTKILSYIRWIDLKMAEHCDYHPE